MAEPTREPGYDAALEARRRRLEAAANQTAEQPPAFDALTMSVGDARYDIPLQRTFRDQADLEELRRVARLAAQVAAEATAGRDNAQVKSQLEAFARKANAQIAAVQANAIQAASVAAADVVQKATPVEWTTFKEVVRDSEGRVTGILEKTGWIKKTTPGPEATVITRDDSKKS